MLVASFVLAVLVIVWAVPETRATRLDTTLAEDGGAT